jgi:pimeloyl-ACP methyl ester carboxylesterase
MTAYPDVAVLLPGFLGFNRFAGFRYFADRVSATLRGGLEHRLKRAVPVIPLDTVPTASLAERQQSLLQQLHGLLVDLGGVERVHLIGHSTGGVDAALLAREVPIRGNDWGDYARDRAKVASVIGIAAPYHGTYLAVGDGARFMRHPFLSPEALLVAPRLVHDLAMGLGNGNETFSDALGAALTVPREVGKFFLQVAANRRLVDDLSPTRMEEYYANTEWNPGVTIRSFVTMAPPERVAEGLRPDPLFSDLYQMAADVGDQVVSPQVTNAVAVLRDALQTRADIVICNDNRRLLQSMLNSFDCSTKQAAGINDGIVNSACQLVDSSSPDELAGIVIADHADVIGHYSRQDAYVQDSRGESLNAGLFTSGARFGDDQFFELYHRVAHEIEQVASQEEQRKAA